MSLTAQQQKQIDEIIHTHDYTDYKWIDPGKIVVAQWVRMKCMFGCPEYGKTAVCPPQTPDVAECERFFKEYSHAVIFHFTATMDKPEDRHKWSPKVNAKLLKMERDVFLAGNERAFLLFMDTCGFCKECTGDRETCELPRMARPAPEAMAVDVYSTVRQFGFEINVRSDYDQQMDRYAFLLVH